MSNRRLIAALAGVLAAVVGVGLLVGAGWAAGPVGSASAAAEPSAPGETITATVSLTPSRDNTLYESEIGAVSNGAGQHLFAGTTNNGDARRAALAFDLAALPPGATVLSATLTLTMSRTTAGETAVTLHALSADWGEGASDAIGEEGAGATAAPDDATWVYTFFDTAQWATPGGDFAATPSATTPVGGTGVYQWSSAGLVADVSGWLADPATNFGWLLRGDESAGGSAKRFDSRENDPANRPRLSVTYRTTVEEAERAYAPVVLR
jgi:hypothetical protein